MKEQAKLIFNQYREGMSRLKAFLLIKRIAFHSGANTWTINECKGDSEPSVIRGKLDYLI